MQGRPRRSGHRHRCRRTIAHRSYGFRSWLVHTRLARLSLPVHSRPGSSHLHSRRAGDAPLRRRHRSSAAAETAGRPRQVTFSLLPTAPPTTTSTSSASGRPLRAARFAPPDRRTDSTSEPAAAEFGGDLWWRAICSYCVSRLDCHVTYYSSHMLYICRYPPWLA